MQTARLPLIFGLDQRNDDVYPWATRRGAGILNGMVYKVDNRYGVEKRKGLSNTPTSEPTVAAGDKYVGVCGDHINPTGTMFVAMWDESAAIRKLYKAGTYIGDMHSSSLQGKNSRVDFTQGDTTLMAIDGISNAGYSYDGTTLAAISGGAWPTTVCCGGGYLDGYYFIGDADNGDIAQSDADDPTTFNSLNVVNAERKPDSLVYVGAHMDHIIAIGDSSIEFFRNAQNPSGSVLRRREDIYYPIGMSHRFLYGNSVGQLANRMFFVGSPQTENVSYNLNTSQRRPVSVYMLDGFSLRKISTKAIDRLLADLTDDPGDSRRFLGHATAAFGRDLYFLSYIPYSNTPDGDSKFITIVYDIEIGIWYQWDMASEGGMAIVGTNGLEICILDDPRMVFPDAGTWTDVNGSGTPTAYTFGVRTSNFDAGTRNTKTLSELSLVGDLISDADEDDVAITYSDDDYQNYSSSRTLVMNDYNKLTGLGSFKRRAFEIEHSGAAPFRAESLELMFEVGDS